eukprot:8932987-Ditylum_brightwellii.AAC.1
MGPLHDVALSTPTASCKATHAFITQPPPQPQSSTTSHATCVNGHCNGITATAISCISLALYVSSTNAGQGHASSDNDDIGAAADPFFLSYS